MTTVDFITDLFYRVDEAMTDSPQHPQARLSPSEVVTLSLLFVLQEAANAPSTAGWSGTIARCSSDCPNARACSACSRHTRTGPSASWQSQPSSAWPTTAMAWS